MLIKRALCWAQNFTYLISLNPLNNDLRCGDSLIPILQVRAPGLRVVQSLAQGHTARQDRAGILAEELCDLEEACVHLVILHKGGRRLAWRGKGQSGKAWGAGCWGGWRGRWEDVNPEGPRNVRREMRINEGNNRVGRGRREQADPAGGSSEVRSHLAGGSRAPSPLPTGTLLPGEENQPCLGAHLLPHRARHWVSRAPDNMPWAVPWGGGCVLL